MPNETPDKTKGRKPLYIAYAIAPGRGKEGKDGFVEIGAAWTLKNRPGLELTLKAHPIGDKIVLLENKANQWKPGGRNED